MRFYDVKLFMLFDKMQIILFHFRKMDFLLLIATLAIAISRAVQYEIYEDSHRNSLVFVQGSKINLQITNKYLFYTFDVSSAQYIISWNKRVEEMCTKNETLPFKFDSEQHVFRNQYLPEPNITAKDVIRIHMNSKYNSMLSEYIEDFNSADKDQTECEILYKMSKTFNTLNMNLNALIRSDVSNLNDTVKKSNIIMETDLLMRENNEVLLPFSINNFNSEFFEYVKFNFFHDNYRITLSFEIPIYKRISLYSVYKKPIMIQNVPYLLKSNQESAVFFDDKPLFFENNSFFRYCFLKNSEYFCAKPQIEWVCETRALNQEELPQDCLIR